MQKNRRVVEIRVQPRAFDIDPEEGLDVSVSADVLVFSIKWAGNADAWDKVRVHTFHGPKGMNVHQDPREWIFLKRDQDYDREFTFENLTVPTGETIPCKYWITFEKADSSVSMTLDPQVILRP